MDINVTLIGSRFELWDGGVCMYGGGKDCRDSGLNRQQQREAELGRVRQALCPCREYLCGSGPQLIIPSREKCGQILSSFYQRPESFKGKWKSVLPQIQECGFLLYRTKPHSFRNWLSKANLWYRKENHKHRCSNQRF
jgi:hypothetical protein